MRNKKLDYTEYREAFYEFMASGKEVRTQDNKEKLILTDNEKWKQCYKPTDKIRKLLPPFWFVSDQGNLISLQSGKAKWLKKDEENGRYSYHFLIWEDEDTFRRKNIEAHNLVWLVFGGKSFGRAEELLEEFGIDAFGVKNDKEIKLNGHHKDKKENNSPDNIEVITTEAHKVIDKVPSPEKMKDSERVNSFLTDFSNMAAVENPNGITVLLTGQKLDKDTNEIIDDDGYRSLESVNSIKFSSEAMKQIQLLTTKAISRQIINLITEKLLEEYGLEYFQEPRYLFTTDYTFYRCSANGTDTLDITEVTDIQELQNKSFIKCYINSNHNAECFIAQE